MNFEVLKTPTISEEQLIGYLKQMMEDYKYWVEKFGADDPIAERTLTQMIACKEMVEAFVMMPVNLRKDYTVTVGF